MHQVVSMTNINIIAMRIEGETWAERFKESMNVNGGDVDHANGLDYVMHFLSFGWKILFAFIPPASIWGGWLCFFIYFIVIGLMTSLVVDMASIFGCLINFKDSVTAITFVSVGSNIASLFASRQAALQEQYADNAIASVTAFNAISVFLGLGLPWVFSAIYWKVQNGQDFHIGGLGLQFNVMIYAIGALTCLFIMILRRCSSKFGKAELGGPRNAKFITATITFSLWIIFIVLNILKSHDYLSFPEMNGLV